MSLFSHAFTLDLAASRTGHEADIGITIKDKTLTDRGRFTGFAETDVAGQFEAVIANLNTDWLPFTYQVDDDGEVVSTLGSRVVNWADVEPADSFTDDDREDIAAIKAKTDLITTGNVTVSSPVNETGTALSLVQGDDYMIGYGAVPEFNLPSDENIEALKAEGDYEIHFVIKDVLDVVTDVTETDDGLTVRVPLTAEQTELLTVSTRFALQSKADGAPLRKKLAKGSVSVDSTVGELT
jgi:hypothetical protein